MTSWDSIAQQLIDRHHVKVDPNTLSKAFSSHPDSSSNGSAAVDIRDVFQLILHSNLPDYAASQGLLPRNAGSLPLATLENSVLVQIMTSRDATQPLRPCADMDDAEALLAGSAVQKATNHRLLRLTVSDGCVEVPAVEMKTLKVFRGIPTPGEKILLKAGTEIRNGMIIMTDKEVEWVGGSEQHLKEEFLLRKHRNMMTGATAHGVEGAPKFAPLHQVGLTKHPRQQQPNADRQHEAASSSANDVTRAARGGGSSNHPRGSGRGAAAAHDGNRGRGNAPHHHDHHHHHHHHHSRGGGGGSRGGATHYDPRGGGGGHYERGGRGRGSDRAGNFRGGSQFGAAMPQRQAVPAQVPQFNDADFPELGGDY